MEPIAIIGMSIRFPGEATSPETFWDMLVAGRSARSEIPANRFNIDAFYHPNPDRIDAMNVRSGHFLRQDPAVFDAPFFSISQSEANSLDPDQRIILETSYHALESAGLPMEKMAGTNTSVFMGTFTREYGTFWSRDPMQLPKYAGTGTGPALLANRVSWFYDLRGTSITLDTACSSSMNALHLACESLRTGGSNAALVGGSNLILNPDTAMMPLTNLGFLSPDGRCYSFDHRANGYARGEGYAVLVLKRLQDAVRDGDTIRAVVRATGSNQDGRTPGISQPRAEAQAALIRQTYASAGLPLADTRFFEAHGTGTAVGDPIEASGIAQVFGPYRSVDSPLYVGAVKSNIGHLEGASALAGLVKAILSLEHGTIPPNINLEKVNPKIPVDDWHISFPTVPVPWPHDHNGRDGSILSIRRASVSSFGYGGANAHVILDDAASYLAAHGLQARHNTVVSANEGETNGNGDNSAPSRDRLFVWSAADEDGIKRLGDAYTAYLAKVIDKLDDNASSSEARLDEIAYTLGAKRSMLPWKSYVVASSLSELHEVLRTAGLPKPVRSSTAAAAVAGPGLAFVFTGQGAQWYAMGRELLVYPVFREAIEQADGYMRAELGCEWSVTEELLSRDEGNTNVDEPAYSQCLCTVLQVALVDLLRSWGVCPTAVVGHSSGEIAAAYCAGGLSRESAWKTAYFRGALAAELEGHLQKTGEPGAMMAVGISEKELAPYLAQLGGAVTVGCLNAPANLTITGSAKSVAALQSELESNKIFCRRLRVSLPYHSPRMAAIAEKYTHALKGICAAPRAFSEGDKMPTMYSSVRGATVDLEVLSKPEYWVSNLVSTVLFSQAVSSLVAATGIEHFVEVGPTAALKRPVQDIVNAAKGHGRVVYYSVLQRGQNASKTALDTAGQLFRNGYAVNITAVNTSPLGGDKQVAMAVDLPLYPFNHSKRYWDESRISKNFRFRKHPRHELLGTPVADWNQLEPRWRNFLRVSESSWIVEHEFNGSAIYPASGMIVMAIEAARQVANPPAGSVITGFRIRDMTLKKALLLSTAPEGVETQLTLRPKKSTSTAAHDAHLFSLYQLSGENEWSELCQGTIITEYADEQHHAEIELPETALALEEKGREYKAGTQRCHKSVETRQLYETLGSMGFKFGPTFQTLHDVHFSEEGDAMATIRLREWTEKVKDSRIQPHVIHPAPLDGVFHLAIVASTKGGYHKVPTSVPTALHDLWISNELLTSGPDSSVGVYTKRRFAGIRDEEYSMVAVDSESGQPRVIVDGYRGTTISSARDSGGEGSSSAMILADKSSPGGGPRRICYEMHWKPDIDLLSPSQLASHCLHRELQKNSASHQRNIHLAEIICLYHMHQELTTHVNSTTPPAHLPHLRRYVDWMAHNLSLPSTQSRLASPEAIQFFTSPTYRDEILSALASDPNHASSGYDLYATVIAHLPEILSGAVDPLTLLFHNETQLVARFYQADFLDANYAQMASYLDLLAHKDANLRVLEVGAGTGGATAWILDVLSKHGSAEEGEEGTPRLGEYVYTDISAGFFAQAKERFAPLVGGERLTFRTLDIEGDLAAQGFGDGDGGRYDAVVAANVLHATRDLRLTVRNVRRLLKDGGKLVLFEVTDLESARITFAFGTLPGWWLGGEDGRKWGPLLSVEQWDGLLRECGFSGAELVLGDTEGKHSFSVIVSEAVPVANGVAPAVPLDRTREGRNVRTVIVVDDGQPVQLAVADALSKTLPQPCETVSLQQLASYPLDRIACVFLPELTRPFLADIRPDEFETLRKLVGSASSILWVTGGGAEKAENPLADLVVGFGRSMCSERPLNLKFCTLALEDARGEEPTTTETITKVFTKLISLPPDAPFETYYMQRNGQVHVGRLVEANYLNDHVHRQNTQQEPQLEPFDNSPTDPDRALSLVIGSPALLDTLHFVHDPVHPTTPLHPDEVEIRVHASGLNFKDVMVAMGQLPFPTIGIECAGTVVRVGSNAESNIRPGDRVCCMTWRGGSFRTYARAHRDVVAHIPQGMTFAQAAAFPVAFLTAYYALFEAARIEKGERVLIHAGAGGVGQAAVQLALMVGAEVFVTVSTEAKREVLVREYGVDPENVFCSRRLSFAKGIMRRTAGQGVDVVLNSLAGDVLKETWRCMAPLGRFVEIGKTDFLANEALPMGQFAKSTTFAAVDLELIGRHKSRKVGEMLRKIMALAEQGKLRTQVPLHVHPVSEIENAFRGLQSGRLAGKVVVEMKSDAMVPVVPMLKTRYHFDPNASYLISGGVGGLGRSIARWMASRGARYLILLSRSGLSTPAAQNLANELARQGVKVAAPPCDVSDADALRAALAHCADESMPPIKGCIQAAMVLRDSIFENMTHADFHAALRPKVQASWNLHAQLPADLSFFILLSSLGGVIGNSGQSNYAAGNTYQDALARHRIARGLPAASLDVGMMLQVGFVAETAKIAESLVAAGYTAMYEAELLAILDYLCDPENQGNNNHNPLRSQILTGVTTQGVFRRRGFEEKDWMRRPEYCHLQQMDREHDTVTINYAAALPTAPSRDAAVQLVEMGLRRKLSKVLFIAEQDIDPVLPVYSAGVDSLVAVELKYWFLKELHAEVAVFNILSDDSLRALCGFAVDRSPFWKGEGGGEEVIVEVK
ncbi:hypothetical protein C8A03DRAFT_40391 [Achaetomium macrosporum]|uniref:Polyketide synthase n=1 Tax=Achaetomium macrosporum TaxID=79813 RepID=A0AAN7CHM2_9PEZI|nr:hypothetical protein C8A03DRAFT_40391 [Achaetomium macrosporum]